MLVRDVMATDVVTVPFEASLRTAGERMLETGVGSVIVTNDGVPTGIVTESDALAAGCLADATFSEIPVEAAMSSPLETIQPDRTLRSAVQRMQDADVKKLPVVEDMDLVGVVTITDVVGNYHEIVKETQRIEQRRADWENERPYDIRGSNAGGDGR